MNVPMRRMFLLTSIYKRLNDIDNRELEYEDELRELRKLDECLKLTKSKSIESCLISFLFTEALWGGFKDKETFKQHLLDTIPKVWSYGRKSDVEKDLDVVFNFTAA